MNWHFTLKTGGFVGEAAVLSATGGFVCELALALMEAAVLSETGG